MLTFPKIYLILYQIQCCMWYVPHLLSMDFKCDGFRKVLECRNIRKKKRSCSMQVIIIIPHAIVQEVTYCLFVFKTGSHYVFQSGLELTMQPRLVSNSQQNFCLSLLNAGIIGVCHHIQQAMTVLMNSPRPLWS